MLEFKKLGYLLLGKMNVEFYHHAEEDVVARMGQQKLRMAVFQ